VAAVLLVVPVLLTVPVVVPPVVTAVVLENDCGVVPVSRSTTRTVRGRLRRIDDEDGRGHDDHDSQERQHLVNHYSPPPLCGTLIRSLILLPDFIDRILVCKLRKWGGGGVEFRLTSGWQDTRSALFGHPPCATIHVVEIKTVECF
jgi:hypothetical protein